MASYDSHFLTFLGSYCIHLLTNAGFVINYEKCILIPTTTITWLGRLISSSNRSITITPHQSAAMIPQLAFLRFVKLTRHTLQRFLGSLQWLSGPSSLNSVNLATAYSLLQKRSLPKTLPLSITCSLISAIIITLLPLYPRPLPPPLTMPIE